MVQTLHYADMEEVEGADSKALLGTRTQSCSPELAKRGLPVQLHKHARSCMRLPSRGGSKKSTSVQRGKKTLPSTSPRLEKRYEEVLKQLAAQDDPVGYARAAAAKNSAKTA